jgi:hypothetical protein
VRTNECHYSLPATLASFLTQHRCVRYWCACMCAPQNGTAYSGNGGHGGYEPTVRDQKGVGRDRYGLP